MIGFYVIYILMGYAVAAVLSEILSLEFITLLYRASVVILSLVILFYQVATKKYSVRSAQCALIFFYSVYILFVLWHFSQGFSHDKLLLWRFYLNNTIFFVILPLIVVGRDLGTRDLQDIKLYGFIFSVSYIALIYFAWFLGHSELYRLSFYKLNPISLSIAAGISIFLFLFAINSRWLKALFVTSSLVLIISSGSRGPVLGLLVVLLVYLLFDSRRSLKLGLITLVSATFIALAYWASELFEAYVIMERFDLSSDKGSMSINIRVNQYESAFNIFLDNFLFGGSLTENYENMYPHNIILEILMSGGLFLLMVWNLVFYYYCKSIYKRIKENGIHTCDYLVIFLFCCSLVTWSLPGSGVLAIMILVSSRLSPSYRTF